MNLIYEKWDDILEYIRTDLEMTTLSFNTWIKPLKIHSLDNNILRILVEMDGAVEYLEKKYKIALQAAIIDVVDQNYEVEFVTKQQAETENLPIMNTSNLMNEVIERANLNNLLNSSCKKQDLHVLRHLFHIQLSCSSKLANLKFYTR